MIETDFHKSLSDEDKEKVQMFYNMIKNNEIESLINYMDRLEMVALEDNTQQ